MTKLNRQMIQVEMDRLTALLRGKTVDGLTLGMNGLSEEWVREAIESRAKLIAGTL